MIFFPFFFFSASWQIHLLFSRFASSFTFPPPLFLKVWFVFISYSSLLEPQKSPERSRNREIHSGLHVTLGMTVFQPGTSWFSIGGVYSMTLWCQRVEVVLVEERQVNMSPNKAWVHFPAALPLATSRSIYKSNRLLASHSPVIYDPAPLTRPASFHFC